MYDHNSSSLIKAMLPINNRIARLFIRDFNELQLLQSSKRPLNNFVANTKRKVESVILEQLRTIRPQFGIITNNYQENVDAEKKWIVSMLDGEDNFARSISNFTFSLAVEAISHTGEHEIIAGMVFAPILNEVYFAEKGQGALQQIGNSGNTNRIRVSERKEGDVLLLANCHHKNVGDINLKNTLMLGCNALSIAYVAAGKAEACALKDVSFCDIAASMIILREAGGVVKKYNVDDDNLISCTVSNQVARL